MHDLGHALRAETAAQLDRDPTRMRRCDRNEALDARSRDDGERILDHFLLPEVVDVSLGVAVAAPVEREHAMVACE